MTHALLTFLGRTPRDQTQGYRKTTYKFPDDTSEMTDTSETTAVLGWNLAKRLEPDRVIILGTDGSMWDFLAESAGIESKPSLEKAWEALMEAVENQAVLDEHLQTIKPVIEEHLGIETQLCLIPKKPTEEDQLKVLDIMAKATEGVGELSLDVSHAFRHLPMIAIVAACYLQSIRNVQLKSLWYGFYDPDTNTGTVYDLKGLLHLFEWVRALSQFKHTGDYGVLADLLQKANPCLEDPTRKAAFFERTTRESLAKNEIDKIVTALEATPLTGSVAGLFQPTLQDHLKWSKKSTPQRRQKQLALDYLERRDYLRAAIYAQEAFVTFLVSCAGGDPDSYNDRKEARDDVENILSKSCSNHAELHIEYRKLSELRNALAHGTEPIAAKVKPMMEDETKLRKQIKKFLNSW